MNDVGSATMVVGTPSLGSVRVAVGTILVTGGFTDGVSITLVGMTMVTGVEGGALDGGSLAGTDDGVAIGVDGGAVSVGGTMLVELVSLSVGGGRGVEVTVVDGPGVGGVGGRPVSVVVELLPSSGGRIVELSPGVGPVVVELSPGTGPVVVVLSPGVGPVVVELTSPGGTETLVLEVSVTSGAELVVVVVVSGGNRVMGGRRPL